MRIVVSQIPDAGKTVPLEGDWAVAAARLALEAEPTRCAGQLLIERNVDRDDKEDGRVVVSGHVSVAANRVCERCGEDVEVVVDTDVELIYAAAPDLAEAGEDEEAEADEDDDILEEDDDDGFYHDDALELSDVLCEAVALELGPRITCADVAACDRRTADLLASKGTSGTPGHPAFAKLKGLG